MVPHQSLHTPLIYSLWVKVTAADVEKSFSGILCDQRPICTNVKWRGNKYFNRFILSFNRKLKKKKIQPHYISSAFLRTFMSLNQLIELFKSVKCFHSADLTDSRTGARMSFKCFLWSVRLNFTEFLALKLDSYSRWLL